MWILEKYVTTQAANFEGYKVLLSKASGTGTFGEVLAAPFIVWTI